MDNVTDILDREPDSVFVLTGDLNTLNMRDLHAQFCFEQMVNLPTHGSNIILDLFITNRSDMLTYRLSNL